MFTLKISLLQKETWLVRVNSSSERMYVQKWQLTAVLLLSKGYKACTLHSTLEKTWLCKTVK